MSSPASRLPETRIERRQHSRSVESREFQPRFHREREFGIGYGRSSGYVHNPSYITSNPALFRCR